MCASDAQCEFGTCVQGYCSSEDLVEHKGRLVASLNNVNLAN